MKSLGAIDELHLMASVLGGSTRPEFVPRWTSSPTQNGSASST
jgi:hypothetical protein